MSSHHDFIQKLSSKLENWDYQLDRLEHRLADLPDDIKTNVRKEIDHLIEKKIALREEINELEEVTKESFDEFSQKMTDAWDGVKFAVNTPEFDISIDV